MSFIDNCFKTFVDKLFTRRPQLITVEKKILFLSLPNFGEISLQTRTKLRKSLEGLLNSCKLQVVFKSQKKLSSVFRFKDHLPFDLVSGVVYKYTCSKCNSTYYRESLLNRVGCVVAWVTWICGLRGSVGTWVAWVKILRGLRR